MAAEHINIASRQKGEIQTNGFSSICRNQSYGVLVSDHHDIVAICSFWKTEKGNSGERSAINSNVLVFPLLSMTCPERAQICAAGAFLCEMCTQMHDTHLCTTKLSQYT